MKLIFQMKIVLSARVTCNTYYYCKSNPTILTKFYLLDNSSSLAAFSCQFSLNSCRMTKFYVTNRKQYECHQRQEGHHCPDTAEGLQGSISLFLKKSLGISYSPTTELERTKSYTCLKDTKFVSQTSTLSLHRVLWEEVQLTHYTILPGFKMII